MTPLMDDLARATGYFAFAVILFIGGWIMAVGCIETIKKMFGSASHSPELRAVGRDTSSRGGTHVPGLSRSAASTPLIAVADETIQEIRRA